jgi:dolichol-phosphate mannosyltransferase
MKTATKLSLILPFYNEEEMIPLLRERLRAFRETLGVATEVICVNDGSRDRTELLLNEWAASDETIKVLHLSRNFGHQVAVTAGLDHADKEAEAVVIMDADLQDPPEVVVEMLAKFREGYDIVYGQRLTREGESLFKKISAFFFYRMMRWLVSPDLPPDTGDFRLMSRRSVDAFLELRERHRFLRGMATWIGFPQTAVPFHRPARAKGETKYPLRKMLGLAWNAAVSFSALPLRLVSLMGLGVTLFGICYTIYGLWQHYVAHDTVRGWTTLVILQCFIGGAMLFGLGALGEYVARIFEESKGRPLYIVREIVCKKDTGKKRNS